MISRRAFLGGLGAGLAAAQTARATLIVRVVDARSKGEIPATIAVTPAENRVLTDNQSFLRGIRSDGSLRLIAPPGLTRVTVQRGFDYSSVDHQLDLPAGEIRELVVELERRTPLNGLGWICGDNHVHMIHGEDRVTTDFPYVARACRAEALDYLSLSQRWQLPDESPEALDQACRAVTTPDFLLTWNMEMPKNYLRGDVSHCLGHGWTVGMAGRDSERRNVIDELNAMNAHDYEREKQPAPNFESHAYVHSLGGIVSYTHPCRWGVGRWGGRDGYAVEEKKFISNMAQELPFDTVAGPTYDMIDVLMQTHEAVQNENALRLWFLLQNHGYRIPATASSDTTFDNPGRGVPGAVRVYTRANGPKAIGSIRAAMKAGRNFVTSGPLMLWTVGDYGIGDSVTVASEFRAQSRLQLWASGAPGEYLTKAEIFRNGELWRTLSIGDKSVSADVTFEIVEKADSWYVARCYGSNDRQVAISNPIYFDAKPYRAPAPAVARVRLSASASAGRTVNGRCEVLEYIGRFPRVIASHVIHDGRAQFDAPATARVRVSVEGHEPQTKSLFLDDPRLLGPCLDMRVEKMLDWSTYESVRRQLRNVQLEFKL